MKKNFAALNGLRAIAAFAVVCFHFCPRPPFWWGVALIQTGPAAVAFFFLLSGFVLAVNHQNVPRAQAFWTSRLIRIYPMYLLAFVLFLPIAFIKYRGDPHTLVFSAALNLAMLQSWTNLAQSWNGPSWSLSVEAFLYFSFPFVLPVIVKLRQPLWLVLPVMVPVALTIAFCSGHIPTDVYKNWIGNNPLFWLPTFGFGVSLGLWRTKHHTARVPVGVLVAAAAIALVTLVIVWPPEYREVFISGADMPAFAAIVLLCTYPSRFVDTMLGNPFIVRLGSASYIAYIIQAPLGHYYQGLIHGISYLRAFSSPDTSIVFFFVYVAGLCAASVVLETFLDEPIRAWLGKLRLNRRQRLSLSRPE